MARTGGENVDMLRTIKERRMRRSLLAMAAVTLAAGTFTIKAEAMPLGGLGSAADSLGLVEQTQYFYGGRDYCWYPDGWHGPGFYWCGYAYRVGYGWGGPIGWGGRPGPRLPPRAGRRLGGPGPGLVWPPPGGGTPRGPG